MPNIPVTAMATKVLPMRKNSSDSTPAAAAEVREEEDLEHREARP